MKKPKFDTWKWEVPKTDSEYISNYETLGSFLSRIEDVPLSAVWDSEEQCFYWPDSNWELKKEEALQKFEQDKLTYQKWLDESPEGQLIKEKERAVRVKREQAAVKRKEKEIAALKKKLAKLEKS